MPVQLQPLTFGIEQDNSRKYVRSGAHVGVVAIAITLAIVGFPHIDEVRNMDEVGYLKGSTAVIEGVPPGYAAAPAGPNTLVGLAYLAGCAVFHLLLPDPAERRFARPVRPFLALDRTLFENCRDLNGLHRLWICSQLLLAVWAVSAAFRLGEYRGGLAGGLLIGGLMAWLPLFREFAEMSRPYMTAWAFAVLALSSAALYPRGRRIMATAIFLGLAIASRIEMLMLFPFVAWEFWNRREPGVPLSKVLVRILAIVALVTLVAAPWLVMHLAGTLRSIATVRFGAPTEPALKVISVLFWDQGLVGPLLLSIVALLEMLRRRDWKVGLLAIYVVCLGLTVKSDAVQLNHHGPFIIALIAFSVVGTQRLTRQYSKSAAFAVMLLLFLPFVQSIRGIVREHREYAADGSIAWVESHVPRGTRVYTIYTLKSPLPTESSSRLLWEEVTNDQAWRRKFRSGLERFNLSQIETPRALSEENLIQERGNRRNFFILGGSRDVEAPRFDVQIYGGSPVFGIQDLASAFAKSGGVIIHQGEPVSGNYGEPAAKWTNAEGRGVFVYCSPDIIAQLH